MSGCLAAFANESLFSHKPGGNFPSFKGKFFGLWEYAHRGKRRHWDAWLAAREVAIKYSHARQAFVHWVRCSRYHDLGDSLCRRG